MHVKLSTAPTGTFYKTGSMGKNCCESGNPTVISDVKTVHVAFFLFLIPPDFHRDREHIFLHKSHRAIPHSNLGDDEQNAVFSLQVLLLHKEHNHDPHHN